jgi:hypothetical protein
LLFIIVFLNQMTAFMQLFADLQPQTGRGGLFSAHRSPPLPWLVE